MPRHYPWIDIEGFQHVKRNLDKQKEKGYTPPIIEYVPKIKLHGTNAAVQIYRSGEIIPQSRNYNLSIVGKDNAGFAKWVMERKEYFQEVQKKIAASDVQGIVIYGEFAGSGIQSGVAVCDIGKKIFSIFAIKVGTEEDEKTYWLFEPMFIHTLIPEYEDIFVLPWMNSRITIDWGSEESMQQAAAQINELVECVEKEDPWVKENFNVSGTGEGVVMYPYSLVESVSGRFTDLIFKAKGEKHRVAKQKNPVQVEVANPSTVLEFVDLMVTEARLNQGLQEACQGVKDIKLLGNFLKWMGQDIKKEGLAELEVGKLAWPDVAKQVNNRCKKWYMGK